MTQSLEYCFTDINDYFVRSFDLGVFGTNFQKMRKRYIANTCICKFSILIFIICPDGLLRGQNTVKNDEKIGNIAIVEAIIKFIHKLTIPQIT